MNEFKGIYYYKREGYPDDVTKNCKLTITELDSNFFNLKSADVKEAYVNEEETKLILVLKNGDQIVADMPFLSNSNFNVEWDKGKGQITIAWGDQIVVIDGLVTNDNVLTNVESDYTLDGDGTHGNPLRIAEVEKTGFYQPLKELINVVSGETLPEDAAVGDRYLTYEEVSDYGFLYNFSAVSEIAEHLINSGSEWRIPTKADWDKLLNFLEPCDYKNHNSDACHVVLGKYAGKLLKSDDGWEDYTVEPYIDSEGLEHIPVQPKGVDAYGFRVLPTYSGYTPDAQHKFIQQAGYWTSTHLNGDEHQDIYVKLFEYNESGVRQEADCPDVFYGLRLVKDYTGSNFNGSEVIEGSVYNTIPFYSINQIWTSSNLYLPMVSGTIIPYSAEEVDKRRVYFITSFNGKGWDRKELKNADTILLEHGLQYDNEQIRVELDENGEQILVSVDDILVERTKDKIMPIIEEDELVVSSALNDLNIRLNNEEAARIAADDALGVRIDNETAERQEADRIINERIDNEEAERKAEDIAINERIDQEIADRTHEDDLLREQLIDNPADSHNPNTPAEYIIKSNSGDEPNLTLFSKGGTNDVNIFFDGNYGELPEV